MNVELVEAWTSDGVRLHGALQAPVDSRASEDAIDAAILLSGVGSNFYGSSLIRVLSETCAEAGVAAVRVNTRGHDTVCTLKTREGGMIQGAALEIVDDCRMDIAAWVDFLVERGHKRIAVVGHSLGAIKALYSQAREPHSSVATVVAVSPPRLNHDAFGLSGESPAFLTSYREAQKLVKEDQPRRIFPAMFPFPMQMAAATYLDKYGPESRYDILKFAHEVTQPVAFIYGQVELERGGVAFAGLDESVLELDWVQPPSMEVIAGANHFYSGLEESMSTAVVKHLASL